MDAKHTPGPWRNGDNTLDRSRGHLFIRGGPEGRVVADVNTAMLGGAEVYEANARLIAAAPELLEACKAAHAAILQLSEYADEDDEDWAPGGYLSVAYEVTRAALAKARGTNAGN